MQRPDASPDHSSALAFIAFAAAAAVWIGVMAVQPKPHGIFDGNPQSLQASVIVMTKDIALARPQPHVTELADLQH
ncbi:hypothetical protein [Tardiphaga robiniae]|uniref:Uncharacterized protein n=1 Tax=Tardiphaga robiniae TaxID=943830 RepID=A0A161QN45_9BRAD|nr:hypothetical protein [Tardiphaga robiniae]KZD21544.1 hypothetical protein A4A58_14435 [Tardiphaga robiniae]